MPTAKTRQYNIELNAKGIAKLNSQMQVLEKRFEGIKKQAKSSMDSVRLQNRLLRIQTDRTISGTQKQILAIQARYAQERRLAKSNAKLVTALREQERLQILKVNQAAAASSKAARAANAAMVGGGIVATLAATAAIVGVVGVKTARTAAEFEALQARLESMYLSVDRGRQAFDFFNQVAATTPFTLQKVVEAGATLKAFGLDAEGTIKQVTDLAAFMQRDLVEAAAAVGRAYAGGVGASEILRESGVIQRVVARTGISVQTFSKDLGLFRKELLATISDPTVGIAGATDRLAQTVMGLESNVGDAFSRLMNEIGKKFADPYKKVLSGLIDLQNDLLDSLRGDLGDSFGALDKMNKGIDQLNRQLDGLGDKTEKELNQLRMNFIKSGGDVSAALKLFPKREDIEKQLAEAKAAITKNGEDLKSQIRATLSADFQGEMPSTTVALVHIANKFKLTSEQAEKAKKIIKEIFDLQKNGDEGGKESFINAQLAITIDRLKKQEALLRVQTNTELTERQKQISIIEARYDAEIKKAKTNETLLAQLEINRALEIKKANQEIDQNYTRLAQRVRNNWKNTLEGMAEDTKEAGEEIKGTLEGLSIELPEIKGLKVEKDTEDSWDAIRSTIENVATGFETVFENGKIQMKDFADVVINSLKKIAAELAARAAIFGLLSLAGAPVVGASLGTKNFADFVFGGFKADGGPVQRGNSYLVGEQGKELFTPTQNGHITPNDQLGGTTYNFNIHAMDADSFLQFARNRGGAEAMARAMGELI